MRKCFAQPLDSGDFETLEFMIDENSRVIIEAAARICETARGGNRETVARAIRELAKEVR